MANNQNRVMTGAIGILRVSGTAVAKLKNISWTESLNRGEVRGIGTTITSETPVLTWGGTWNADFYEVDFSTTGIPGIIRRDVQTNQQFEDQLVLEGDGAQLDIFKKAEDLIDSNTGLIVAKAVPYATLGQVYIESDGADLTEGAISGHRQSGRYLFPIKAPK